MGGVAFSADGGGTWMLRNAGIIATNINLLATDPVDPGVVYAASAGGEGTFRSDDYGTTWDFLNPGGIVHPWGDELVVDPRNGDNVWFVSDVPYIHRSRDRGETWDVVAHPYEGGSLNFFSVYAMAQADDPSVVYALSNGFGIFKAQRSDTGEWDWRFLRQSEVDYTYSMAVEPGDPNVLYSGFSRKPFESGAKIRATYDGGSTWLTALEIEGAQSVTSVAVDPAAPTRVFAVSVGDSSGADLWATEDRGLNWQPLGQPFSFTTIHSYAVSDDGLTAFAGVWGGGTYRTTDGGDTWEKLAPPEALSAAALALGPNGGPNDPPILYLADRTSPALYRSIDGGDSFDPWLDAGPEYRRLMNVTVDPTDAGRLYVAAMERGGYGQHGSLFRVDNSVVADITGTLPKLVLSLTVDPGTPTTLYAVLHESGVYRSTDGGATWLDISDTESGLPDSGFLGLICHPANPSILYLFGGCDVRFATVESAGLDPDLVHGVYRSMDGGDWWENINNGVLGSASGAIKSLSFDPDDPGHLVVAAENGCYTSGDGGDSWVRDTRFPYAAAAGIVLRRGSAFAFTNGAGVYRGALTEEGSVAWERTPRIRAGVAFAQVKPHPLDAGVLYATGYPGGVFKSTDGGQTWHERNFGMVSFSVADPLRQGYYALDISQSDPRVLYLGLYGKGVYRSDNSAETWRPVHGSTMELYRARVTALAVDRQDSEVVTVATEAGVYQTIDGGLTWQLMQTGLPTTDIRVLHTNAAHELFAGTKGFGMYQWEGGRWEPRPPVGNWGVIWPMWDDRPLYQYTSLLIHPEDSSRMLIGTFPQGIYANEDRGQTWRESNVGWTNDGVFSLVTHPDNPEIVYAGTYNGMNRSLDFGASWEMWDTGMPAEQWVFSIDFDPGEPDVMYACSKNGEDEGRGSPDFRGSVMKSVDGGATWFEITGALDVGQEFYKIIVDRFSPNTLYLAAQNDGMLISRDGGTNWSPWNEGLANTRPGTNGNNVTNTLGISADGSVLYFGTAGSGVFRRTVAPILPVHHLSASVDADRIRLNWRFDDLNENFGAFNIYRGTEPIESLDGLSAMGSSVAASEVTFDDLSVTPGQSYYYVVTTVDQAGFENLRATALGPVVLSAAKRGDFNGDQVVDFDDFYLFADQFGSSDDEPDYDPAFDLTGDGRIDFGDFWEFADLFGR